MLRQRVITGFFIGLGTALVVLFSDMVWVMKVVVSFLSGFAVHELFQVSGLLKQSRIAPWLFGIAMVWGLGFSFLPYDFYLPVLAFVFVLAMMLSGWNMLRFGAYSLKKPWIIFVISLIFPILYNSIAVARLQGLPYLIFILLSCFGTDTGAYFVGRAFGKHKLAPVISPKKTVEGFFGGVAISACIYAIVGLILLVACQATVNFMMLIVLGLVCGVLDQFGDLSMSAIKRTFEVKDFGAWMPGHGGVLDRFDSLLYVGPCVCLFIMWIHPLYS